MKKYVIALVLGFTVACATVQTNPNPDSVAQTRATAQKVKEGLKTTATVLQQVVTIVDALPLTKAQKDDFDCAVIKATGLTTAPSQTVITVCGAANVPNGEGPLPKTIKLMDTVTDLPSLKTTLKVTLDLITPLVSKLNAATDPGLRSFAAILTTALEFSRTLLGA